MAQDPESLNPVAHNSIYSWQILDLIFQGLLTIDRKDNTIKPFLVEAMPEVTHSDTASLLHYRIRNKAKWDNGSPVTSEDVEFTIKVINSPLVNNERVRPYLEFIKNVIKDPVDGKHFTLVCSDYSPELELQSGLFYIIPRYLFDPEGLLDNFSVQGLKSNFDSLSGHPDIIKFATKFNSADFSRNKDYLKGSGGYNLTEWKTGRYIILDKKKDWWAEKLNNPVPHLTANPQRINFQVITDNATAIIALENGQIDVYDNIPATEFDRLKRKTNISDRYNLFTPETYKFYYIGLNSRIPKFAGKKTRQALAHLLNVNDIIKAAEENFAIQTIGPISPNDKLNFNNKIQPYSFDKEKAKALLREDGWMFNNGKWLKNVAGKEIVINFTIIYKAGSQAYENIALIFKQAASSIGIPVEIQPVEGKLLSEKLKTHDFEVFIRALVGGPFAYNFKAILHRESAGINEGNYTGFGNAESDSLIEVISVNADLKERADQLKRFQEIIHDEAAMLMLYFTQDRIAIHNRFSNLEISTIEPGYDVSAFINRER